MSSEEERVARESGITPITILRYATCTLKWIKLECRSKKLQWRRQATSRAGALTGNWNSGSACSQQLRRQSAMRIILSLEEANYIFKQRQTDRPNKRKMSLKCRVLNMVMIMSPWCMQIVISHCNNPSLDWPYYFRHYALSDGQSDCLSLFAANVKLDAVTIAAIIALIRRALSVPTHIVHRCRVSTIQMAITVNCLLASLPAYCQSSTVSSGG